MSVYRRLLCTALALCLMITLLPVTGSRTAARAETKRYGYTTMDKVNARHGAGTDKKIAFSLPANHVCEILETTTVQKVKIRLRRMISFPRMRRE